MTDDDTVAAWGRVHEALERLPGWRATACTLQEAELPAPRWHVTAAQVGVAGRAGQRASLEGVGATEQEALEMLARLLEERFSDPPGRIRIRVPPR